MTMLRPKMIRPWGGIRLRPLVIAIVMAQFAGGAATAGPEQWPTQQPTFARAVETLRRGDASALAMLEELARRGDARAQLALGRACLDGKLVPQDRVQGYAWLAIAAEGHAGSFFGAGTQEQARLQMLDAARSLSGPELIRADQAAIAFRAEREQAVARDVNRVTSALTGQTPVSTETLEFASDTVTVQAPRAGTSGLVAVPGCAATPDASGCPRPAEIGGGTRCSGEIPRPDHRPSTGPGPGTHIVSPVYPLEARKWSVEGAAGVLAHVDSSGWICLAAMAVGSGAESLDTAALDAVRRWRVVPAMKAATPVESLGLFFVDFRKIGYVAGE